MTQVAYLPCVCSWVEKMVSHPLALAVYAWTRASGTQNLAWGWWVGTRYGSSAMDYCCSCIWGYHVQHDDFKKGKKKKVWHISFSIFKHLKILLVLNYSSKITSKPYPPSWNNFFPTYSWGLSSFRQILLWFILILFLPFFG